jgi:anti-sigma B factor antagonist
VGVTELSVSASVEDGPGGPRTVVRLAGEADVTTQALADVLEAEGAKRPRLLLIDASALTFIDSAAIHQIVLAHRRLRASDGQLALISPSLPVARVLQLSGLDTVIPVHASVDEAAGALLS